MCNYSDLALVMGTHPKLAIFKQFKTANVRNLLILQAQILTLSHQLGHIIKSDRISDIETHRKLEKYVLELQDCEDDEDKAVQWNKIKEIRGLLTEYNQLLLQLQAVLRLPAANRTNLAALRGWLKNKEGGNDFLTGIERTTFDEEQDLTSLVAVEENKDVISRWIEGTLTPWFYHRIGYRFKDHTVPIWDPTLTAKPTRTRLDFIPDSSVLVTTISAIFASLLLTLSLFALYYIKSDVVRLGMITIFASMFSLIVALFTNAKRSDCLASTAAFSAVLAVFIGSTTGNTSSTSSS